MKHWIFDLDGTLVDSVDHYYIKLEKVFERQGIPFTPDARRKSENYFDAKAFFALYLDPQKVEEAWFHLRDLSVEMAPLVKSFNGMVDVLSHLDKNGAHLSLWTGRDLDSGVSILKHTGLERFFKNVVTGTCVEKCKPDPEGLLKLLKDTGFKNTDSIMIGDHAYDIQGAKSAGMKSVSVSWQGVNQHPMHKESDYHFTQVLDLHNWVVSSIR